MRAPIAAGRHTRFRCTDILGAFACATVGSVQGTIYDATYQSVGVFRQKSSKPAWLIDLEYKPTEGIMMFGKYARGYRTGGISGSLPRSVATSRPEKVDSFELGVKSDSGAQCAGSST